MKAFEDKNTDERYTYALGFSRFLVNGLTITSQSCSIEVHEDSEVPDGSPGDMLDGAAQLNSASVVIDGIQVPIGGAVLQAIKGGVEGCTYVVKFQPTLSNGDKPIGMRTLTVAKYVP